MRLFQSDGLMRNFIEKIEDILPFVMKPGRYFGGEWGSVRKDPASVKARICLIFPDVYEIGMSHTGHQVIYNAVNSRDEFAAERCYSPWMDMEKTLRENDLPLYSLETFTPLAEFDALGFTLAHEMCFTNVLQVIDLAGLPLKASEREYPIVIGGGPVAFNPEPLAEFFDCFVLGDGEDAAVAILEILEKSSAMGNGNKPAKSHVLAQLAEIPGVYVPSHFMVSYKDDGRVGAIKNVAGGPEKVARAFVENLDTAQFPLNPVIPHIQSVHCRAVVEPARGCTQGCRFCQAGYSYRPYRMRSPETVLSQAGSVLDATGYPELGLLALSATDYPDLPKLVRQLAAEERVNRLDCSLPSSRIDAINDEFAQELADAGRSAGLTLAIEAGSQRLRKVINKDFSPESINGAVESAVLAGFELLKLYFMVGLPTETDEDIRSIISCVDSILGTVNRLKDAGTIPKGKRFRLRISVANFVPKPHTPFQWLEGCGAEELEHKQRILRPLRKRRNVQVSYHDIHTSYLEMIFSRGDRRLSGVLERAYLKGARFDAWNEAFDFGRWMKCFEEEGIDPEFYLVEIPVGDLLPWSHLSSGVDEDFFRDEYTKAMNGETTPDCNVAGCVGCGLQKRKDGCFPIRYQGGSG